MRSLAARTKIVYADHVGPPVPHLAAFGPVLTSEGLDGYLTTLRRHFEFASLPEVLDENRLDAGSSRRLVVTVDDGFDLIASGVIDVLNADGVKATTLLPTAMLGNCGLVCRNKLSAIQSLRPADRLVRAYNTVMQRTGHPGIRDACELGQTSVAFSYPFG
jgi:hypothetical protein